MKTLVPVNSTAARVVSRISPEETEIEALVREVQNLDKAITAAKKTKMFSLEFIKDMGVQKHNIQMKIKELKGNVNARHRERIDFHFLEVCRANMSKPEFDKWLRLATQNRDKNT